MQKYYLCKRWNFWNQLALVLSPFILVAFIAIRFAWDYSYYGPLGLVFIVLILCFFLYGNFLTTIKHEICIEDGILYIKNTRTNTVRKTKIDDIRSIRQDRRTYIITSGKSPIDQIRIQSKNGKTIFDSSNKRNPNDYYCFLSELCNIIKPTEYLVYEKNIKNRVTDTRILFINPRYSKSTWMRFMEKMGSINIIYVFIILLFLFVIINMIWDHISR